MWEAKQQTIHPVRADELYTSTLFQKQIAVAKKLFGEDKTYILSAEHGLLRCNEHVFTYDKSAVNPPNFVYFGGKNYLPKVHSVFQNGEGIGSRIGILHSILETLEEDE